MALSWDDLQNQYGVGPGTIAEAKAQGLTTDQVLQKQKQDYLSGALTQTINSFSGNPGSEPQTVGGSRTSTSGGLNQNQINNLASSITGGGGGSSGGGGPQYAAGDPTDPTNQLNALGAWATGSQMVTPPTPNQGQSNPGGGVYSGSQQTSVSKGIPTGMTRQQMGLTQKQYDAKYQYVPSLAQYSNLQSGGPFNVNQAAASAKPSTMTVSPTAPAGGISSSQPYSGTPFATPPAAPGAPAAGTLPPVSAGFAQAAQTAVPGGLPMQPGPVGTPDMHMGPHSNSGAVPWSGAMSTIQQPQAIKMAGGGQVKEQTGPAQIVRPRQVTSTSPLSGGGMGGGMGGGWGQQGGGGPPMGTAPGISNALGINTMALQSPGGPVPMQPPQQMAHGGPVKKDTDTIPAMLTPGEFVVNRKAAQDHMGELQQINRDQPVQHLQYGGEAENQGPELIGWNPEGPAPNQGGDRAIELETQRVIGRNTAQRQAAIRQGSQATPRPWSYGAPPAAPGGYANAPQMTMREHDAIGTNMQQAARQQPNVAPDYSGFNHYGQLPANLQPRDTGYQAYNAGLTEADPFGGGGTFDVAQPGGTIGQYASAYRPTAGDVADWQASGFGGKGAVGTGGGNMGAGIASSVGGGLQSLGQKIANSVPNIRPVQSSPLMYAGLYNTRSQVPPFQQLTAPA